MCHKRRITKTLFSITKIQKIFTFLHFKFLHCKTEIDLFLNPNPAGVIARHSIEHLATSV